MSYFLKRHPMNNLWHDKWLGNIESMRLELGVMQGIWQKNSLNWLKGVRWLTKVDRLGDKLNTQLFRYANTYRYHVQRWTVDYHKYKWKKLPFHLISPYFNIWVPLFIFTSSKRVINTHYSSSSDESILTCFMNLRKEGFVPR